MSEASPLLAVDDLSIEFRTRSGTVRALEKVGFDVGRGETVPLVRESGSGKSVTAYALFGLLDPAARVASGRILFGGMELLEAGERTLQELRGRGIADFAEPAGCAQPGRRAVRRRPVASRRHNASAGAAAGNRDAGQGRNTRPGAPVRPGARACAHPDGVPGCRR
jgi:peptide/nickel transport system ATP-binding protein